MTRKKKSRKEAHDWECIRTAANNFAGLAPDALKFYTTGLNRNCDINDFANFVRMACAMMSASTYETLATAANALAARKWIIDLLVEIQTLIDKGIKKYPLKLGVYVIAETDDKKPTRF